MSANTFTISSTWEPRVETPETLGRRMLKSLDSLADINRYFREWWFLDSRVSVVDMIENGVEDIHVPLLPLDSMRARMSEIVEYGVRKDDDGKPEPEGGYWITAFNSKTEGLPYRVCLSAHGGGVVDPRAGLRVAKFETESDPERVIVSYPEFKFVMRSIVSAWEVSRAQAYSDDLRKLWSGTSFDLAWMTYLSPKLAKNVTPPGDVLVERHGDGGLLMIAAEETFDTGNPKHMAAARSILSSLSDLNAEMEAEAKRLWPTRRL